MSIRFYKYHGLGNDYIVIDPSEDVSKLTSAEIVRICHRNFGIGGDGILLGPFMSDDKIASVKIFNPDGSEAEKSGNGLRIFARYLWDKGLASDKPFTISAIGGRVEAKVLDNGKMITVEMGRVSFDSGKIPVAGPPREVINEKISIDGHELSFCAATIGNPHCVILQNEIFEETARRLGPKLETHPLFPNRTNVQFVKIINRSAIRIEIWERGAGYTLASGSSSCAAAATAFRLGLCEQDIAVHMPGGILAIHIEKDYSVKLTGPVVRVGEGLIDPEIFS